MSGDTVGVTTKVKGAIGIWWVEARDLVKGPLLWRTAPHNRESYSPNVKSEGIEKLRFIPSHELMIRSFHKFS